MLRRFYKNKPSTFKRATNYNTKTVVLSVASQLNIFKYEITVLKFSKE